MPDAIFDDPRLAILYDAFDGPRDDLVPYRAMAAELGAGTVLDLGCGTGSLALLLSADGLDVTAVDPAAASLDVARAKPGADRVTWLVGDATSLPPLQVDLVTLTGNVAQVFLDDDEWHATLRGLRAALRPGGHLVLETRRPERRAWVDWAADTAPTTRVVAGVGEVEERREVLRVDLPLVSFRHTYRFATDGTELVSESTIRFRGRDEVTDSLRSCGLEVVDVRDAPDRPGREHVFLARG